MASVSAVSSVAVPQGVPVSVPESVPMPDGDYKVVSFISSQSLGLGLAGASGGGVIVTSVQASSPAYGVPDGTKILAVNGQSCYSMPKNCLLYTSPSPRDS